MKNVSIKDIAKMAGVVPSTVSLVLNGKAKQMRISEPLAEKIKALAEKAGYQPNHVAVSLRTGNTKIFGLIVEDISNIFFATLAKVIEDEVQSHGYKVVYCSTENDTGKGNDLVNMLFQRQVDGYIIVPVDGMQERISDLVKRGKPTVLIDRYFPSVDVAYVVVDNYAGVEMGLKCFIEKGHKNIGFITLDTELIQMQERERAYRDVMKRHKLPVTKKSILKIPYSSSKKEIIATITDYLKNRDDIDAVFFATNYLAVDGLESISNLSIKIPGQLAVICFDDHDIFKLFPPGISAIEQPMENLGKTAVRLLMEQVEARSELDVKESQVKLPVKLISRGSV